MTFERTKREGQMATKAELERWLGTGVEAACVLETPYRTLRGWALKLKLPGRRGHKRYGRAELIKFRIASILYSKGFSTQAIRSFLAKGWPWILAKLEQAPDAETFFVVHPQENELGSAVYEFSQEKFPAAHQLLMAGSPEYVAVLLFPRGIIEEVDRRLSAHLDKTVYVPPVQRMKEAFERVRKAKELEQLKNQN
jgi:hypothetical protein